MEKVIEIDTDESIGGGSSPENKDHTIIVINDWNEDSVNTVKQWQSDLLESSFIYGEQLEDVEYKMNVAVNLPMILGVIITLIAGINSALSLLENVNISHWVPFSLNITVFCMGAVCSICSGLIKNLSWDETVKKLTKFIEKLDSQWAVFETEMMIPAEQRQNALDFIKREDGNYLHLIQNSPHLSVDDNIKYKEAYLQKMKKHQEWQQRMQNMV